MKNINPKDSESVHRLPQLKTQALEWECSKLVIRISLVASCDLGEVQDRCAMDVEIPLHPLKDRPFVVFSYESHSPFLYMYGRTVLDTSFNIFKCKYLSDAVSVCVVM